jgi:hypothetical protein
MELTTPVKHRIAWFVYAGREKIRKTSTMRGQWGYDVECSCGWESHTGGATRGWIDQIVWEHKNGFGD